MTSTHTDLQGLAGRWNFINSGFHSGQFNMDFDEWLAHRHADHSILPSLRVYGWNPPAISLGYNQRQLDVDLEKCRLLGIDVVRRPTGGRAIYHHHEVTYSIVMASWGRSILSVYRDISEALVEGIQMLGVDVSYTQSQPSFSQLYRSQASIPCFSSSAKYEIQYGGKKLVGSAQRRYTMPDGLEIVLQHGSILLGVQHRALSDLISIGDQQTAQTIVKDLMSKTTELETILHRPVAYDEVTEAIRRGFEKRWNIVFDDEQPVMTREDEGQVASNRQLMKEREIYEHTDRAR